MSDNPLTIDLDLSGVSTTVPLVSETTARVRVQDITEVERDGHATIKWKLTLQEPCPTEDGGTVSVGFPLFVNFDPQYEWTKQKIAKFIDGFLGTGDHNNKQGKPARPRFNAETVSRLIGAEARAKIVVRKSPKSDYVGNEVTAIYPLNGQD